VATFGLVLTIFGCLARTPDSVAYAVGLYITAAYWFTALNSFADPAVTLARGFTTICVKPSQFIDETAQMDDFCRELAAKTARLP